MIEHPHFRNLIDAFNRWAIEMNLHLTELGNIVHNITDHALILDKDWCVIDLNEAAQKALGQSNQDIIGVNFHEKICNQEGLCNDCPNREGSSSICNLGSHNKKFKLNALHLNFEEDACILLKLEPLAEGYNQEAVIQKIRQGFSISIITTDSIGQIIYTDDQEKLLSCFRKPFCIGDNILDVFPADHDLIKQYLNSEQRVLGFEIARIKCEDYGFRYLHIDIVKLPEKDGIIFWLFHQIDDEEEIITDLQHKEHFLGDIFKSVPLGIVVLSENKIYYLNKHLSMLTGFTSKELLGKTIDELFIDKDFYTQIFTDLHAKFEVLPEIKYATSWKKKDGSELIVELRLSAINFKDISQGLIILVSEIDSDGHSLISFLEQQEGLQDSLAQNTISYKTIFNSVQEGIAITSPDNLEVLLINKALCESLKYLQDEIVGKPLNVFLTRETEPDKVLKNLGRLTFTEIKEFSVSNKENELIYFDIRTSQIVLNNKKYTAFCLIDVTERVEQQNKLEKINHELRVQKDSYSNLNKQLVKVNENFKIINSELLKSKDEFYQLFIEMASGFAVCEMMYDEENNPVNFKYLSVNPAFERLLGIPAEKVVGKTSRDVFPDLEECWYERYEQVIKYEKPLFYIKHVKKGNKYFESVVYSSDKGRFAIIFNDVTQTIRSRNELDKLFNLSIDLICIINQDGRFVKTNPALQKVLGINEKDLLDKKLVDFFRLEENGIAEHEIFEELRDTDIVKSVQSKYITPEGKEIWLSWTIQGFTEESTLFAIGRDITPIKETELKFLIAKEKAEEGDRLKSAFLANMSHEVRTPMNAIIGFSSLLDNDSLEAKKRKKYIQIIQGRCDDLLRIINDILDISRIEAGQLDVFPETFYVSEFLAEIMDAHKYRLKSAEKTHLNIELVPPMEDFLINNDKQRLVQVLNNLLDNAIKFTLEGTIIIGCEQFSDSQLMFYVQDTGIGIPEDKFDVIFQRFRQAEDNLTRKYGGNGLGLAISRSLVELMGGNLWLESEEGIGSKFMATIKKTLEKHANKSDQHLENKRILLVEGDRYSAGYFAMVFEELGVKLTHARTGYDALHMIDQGMAFDLILMDIQLADMSGLDVTRIIRERDTKTPIIAQAVYAQETERDACIEAGCDDYFTKPADDTQLTALIAKHLNK